MATAKASVCVDVPAEVIQNEMTAQVVKALAEIDQGKLVQRVVGGALAEKRDG